MTHLTLVHGAWHEGWAWDPILDKLGAAVTHISAPSLLPDTNDTHSTFGLTEQANLLAETLTASSQPSVIVAHSHGGLIAQAAAARVPEAVAGFIGVDAWMGEPGQSFFDVIGPLMRSQILSITDTETGLVSVPPVSMFGVTDEEAAEELLPRLRKQPLKTFTEPLPTPVNVSDDPLRRGGAIICEPRVLPFHSIARSRAYPLVTIESGHDAMLLEPQKLASAIRTILGLLSGQETREPA